METLKVAIQTTTKGMFLMQVPPNEELFSVPIEDTYPYIQSLVEKTLLQNNTGLIAMKILLEDSVLPLDRRYRRAWELQGEDIGYNLSIAKDILKANLRDWRSSVMDRLDVEYMKTLEQGDVTRGEQIAMIKQELRDITSIAVAFSSIAEVDSFYNTAVNAIKVKLEDLNIYI